MLAIKEYIAASLGTPVSFLQVHINPSGYQSTSQISDRDGELDVWLQFDCSSSLCDVREGKDSRAGGRLSNS